jgi:hypothetical protein
MKIKVYLIGRIIATLRGGNILNININFYRFFASKSWRKKKLFFKNLRNAATVGVENEKTLKKDNAHKRQIMSEKSLFLSHYKAHEFFKERNKNMLTAT